jgi:hypothetical protein
MHPLGVYLASCFVPLEHDDRPRGTPVRRFRLRSGALDQIRRALHSLAGTSELLDAGGAVLAVARQLREDGSDEPADELLTLLGEEALFTAFVEAAQKEPGEDVNSSTVAAFRAFLGERAPSLSVATARRLDPNLRRVLSQILLGDCAPLALKASSIPALQRLFPKERALLKLRQRDFGSIRLSRDGSGVHLMSNDKALLQMPLDDFIVALQAGGIYEAVTGAEED